MSSKFFIVFLTIILCFLSLDIWAAGGGGGGGGGSTGSSVPFLHPILNILLILVIAVLYRNHNK